MWKTSKASLCFFLLQIKCEKAPNVPYHQSVVDLPITRQLYHVPNVSWFQLVVSSDDNRQSTNGVLCEKLGTDFRENCFSYAQVHCIYGAVRSHSYFEHCTVVHIGKEYWKTKTLNSGVPSTIQTSLTFIVPLHFTLLSC